MLRRSFLIGAASTLLTTAFYKDVIRYTERKASPLIVPPDDYHTVLYAVGDGTGGYDLWYDLLPQDDQLPDWTWREFTSNAWNWDEYELAKYLKDCNTLDTDEEAEALFDTPADPDTMLDWFIRNDGANARAYHELRALDLGPKLGAPGARGELRFIDGPCMGNDSLIVKAHDMTSLSLLQARLIEIDAGMLVQPAEWGRVDI